MGLYYYTFAFKDEILDRDEPPKKYPNGKKYNTICQKTIYYDNFVSLGNPKRKAEWGTIANNDDIYICEGMWSTLEPGDDSISLQKILLCHD